MRSRSIAHAGAVVAGAPHAIELRHDVLLVDAGGTFEK
jgi:hypothetical protein